jgi:hypothetical protein
VIEGSSLVISSFHGGGVWMGVRGKDR